MVMLRMLNGATRYVKANKTRARDENNPTSGMPLTVFILQLLAFILSHRQRLLIQRIPAAAGNLNSQRHGLF
jgi:hypothetical protein